MDALIGYLEDQSLLLITHQPIGLKKLDEIIVLDSGKIVEQGRYEELIHEQGHFAENWKQSYGTTYK